MAVSFALNDRPGVSEPTRARIRELADELGWRRNAAAMSLTARRANAMGLVLTRPAEDVGNDSFYMRLLAGIESSFVGSRTTLALHVVSDPADETEVYRTIVGGSRVDAVLLTDLVHDDPRVDLVQELGVPAVVLGAEAPGLPVLASDDGGAMAEVLEHLGSLGHRRVARVTGPARFQHTQRRTETLLAGAEERGMEARVVSGEDVESTAAVTAALLEREDRPTAIVFDSDLQAVIGLQVARRHGLDVPAQLSVVAWDGSALSAYAEPPITAIERDILALGAAAGRSLLRAADGDLAPGFVEDGHDFSSPVLRIGGTTARVPS
ncbi:LacI family transcriptional regulator [Frondihabitans sucicola]|uniref:LacI family transcriptional regulator n=2 Tax=Frondihabitans sucicola TaxID=1268041 RepID=A0ABN6XWQ0_9MICO|nr:LacI family transcriptional regulator [Frondihabitans sucicola]